jgi:hypothetical protein
MSSRSSAPAFDEADFKKRLTDEYKILQDKIDKIGGFRFVIKGWSVTAVIAASAAGSATRSLLTVFTISAGLALMLLLFFLFEFGQVKLSRIFGARASRLEGSFRRMDRGYGRTMRAQIPVPYTAHETVESLRQQRLFGWPWGASRNQERFSKRLANWWHTIVQADLFFYLVLIFMAFALPLLPRYRAIEARWKQFTTAQHSPGSAGAPTRPDNKPKAPVVGP